MCVCMHVYMSVYICVCIYVCMCVCVRYEWSSTGLANLLYTLRGTGKVSRIDTVSVASVRVMDE